MFPRKTDFASIRDVGRLAELARLAKQLLVVEGERTQLAEIGGEQNLLW